MPTLPRKRTLSENALNILNAIRNNASVEYRNKISVATDTSDIRKIGAILGDYQGLRNEFLNLLNRIAKIVVTTKFYENPLACFKKGFLEFGETVEEIFVELCKVQSFNPDEAENKLFKREIPDVKTAFHIMNYQKFYKITVSDKELRQAFLSVDGVVNLTNDIIQKMYTSAEYDEFQVMKYLNAVNIINGRVTPIEIDFDNVKSTMQKIKATSNDFTFMTRKFNPYGVRTHAPKVEQFILISSEFDSAVDVELLASAFNMSKADVEAKKVLIDGFGNLDTDRLDEIFEGDTTYKKFTSGELEALNTIPAQLVEVSYFQIYDNLLETTDVENAQGLYWNYFLHTWKTFSISPFANTALFIPATPTVVSVEATEAVTVSKTFPNATIDTVVTTTNFAPKTVLFEYDSTDIEVSPEGVVTLINSEAASGTVTVTVKSTFDNTKTTTTTVNIS